MYGSRTMVRDTISPYLSNRGRTSSSRVLNDRLETCKLVALDPAPGSACTTSGDADRWAAAERRGAHETTNAPTNAHAHALGGKC